MPNSQWSPSFTESLQGWEGEGKEKFYPNIQAHEERRTVAYEVRGKDCKTVIFVAYEAGYKLHFRPVMIFKPI